MVGMKYPPIPICCIPPICCILIPAIRWMYWLARWAFLSSFLWARATYSGLATMIRPFISVTALVASSGELKQTNPNPLDLPSSHITLALVMVPYGVNSFLSLSSSMESSRFLTYKFTPW